MDRTSNSVEPGCQCSVPAPAENDSGYGRILWIALVANLAMFFIEAGVSLYAESAALLADAADFLGDSGNYALSLWALSHGVRARAGVALFKAAVMIGFGVLVLGRMVWLYGSAAVPDAAAMGSVAVLALVVNVAVAAMLFRFRGGDANMRSVWLCSRNILFSSVLTIPRSFALSAFSRASPRHSGHRESFNRNHFSSRVFKCSSIKSATCFWRAWAGDAAVL